MPKILELDPHVADLIAAGEVVERPASVVKELIENSIDAGAGIITVEINAGGMTYIRVTDNGCGIAPEDARTAFLRHATSKLRGAEGLDAIGTLGFRGEALAAIAAVSRIELLTREHGAREGVSITLEAGEVRDVSPAGCPEGTTIIVRDLFFNTPARSKFMKSDRAEGSAVTSTVQRCALSHPETSVRLIKDGKTECHTPGDSRVDSCIYSLFGRDFSAGMIAAGSEDDIISTTGYVSAPSAARGNRSYQFFFVNGRSIRSKTLQAALEQAYANSHPSGRYPSCVLYTTVRLGDVDVNVHPAKTEVKFVSDKQVFDSVYYAVLGALDSQRREQPVALQDYGSQRREQPVTLQDYGSQRREQAPALQDYGSQFSILNSPSVPYRTPRDSSAGTGGSDTQRYSDASVHGSAPAYSDASSVSFRVIGEALNTYIIVERDSSLWLIDKHAAHERIHFDALRSEGFSPMSQALITPIICRHGHEDAALLLENAELLDKLGFTIESFGEDSIAVRSIPAEIDISETEPVLSEVCVQLKLGGSAEPTRRDEIYRSVACKAAIKAGRSSETDELRALTARVMSGEISSCPHGRPVAFELTKSVLDRSFKRS